tara:strand:- start:221 stop:1081 length:861 start_codon:yes stop_codon:yes gene_type:complete
MSSNVNSVKAPLRDRMVVYVGVILILLASWAYIIGMGWEMGTLPFISSSPMDGMQMDDMKMNMQDKSIVTSILTWMPPMSGDWLFTDFLFLFLMWAVMMIAMMTPSILPMIMLFTTLNSKNSRENKVSASPLYLLSGYLMSWVLFSLLITLPQYGLHKIGLLNPMMEPTHALLGGFVLIGAGLYQFSSYKDACLSVCQSPLTFMMNNWKEGSLGAFIIGYKHGFYCVGCCWFLMLTLFALGVMNIMWVVILTLFVMFEKLSVKFPMQYRYTTGTIFIIWGLSIFYF